MKNKILNIMLMFVLFSPMLFAEATDYPPNYYNWVGIFFLIIITIVFLLMIFAGSPSGNKKFEEFPWKEYYSKYIVASAPIEKENDIMLDHEYDGIKELDNKIPPWFSYLFYITIIFAVYYMLDYHVFGTSKLQHDEYIEQMENAERDIALYLQKIKLEEASKGIIPEIKLLTDENSINHGKEIFLKNCASCHGNEGGGIVGPNLTDDYWIHGGGIENIYNVIKKGVPAKGMISWELVLNHSEILQTASFVHSLHGTNPLTAKGPEGDLYIEQEVTPDSLINNE